MVKPHFLLPLLREPEAPWTLVHVPSGEVLVDRLHTAFDSASRREGLLTQQTWPRGSGLIIAPCQAVHTVGMRFPIDVVFVDKAGTIVKVRRDVRPWRIAVAVTAFATIELIAGSLNAGVGVGDTLSLSAAT
jgi:uncharacterized membrane protein (UPF0127 family)